MAEETSKKRKKRGEPAVHVERFFTIPLRNLAPRWRRAEKAAFRVRAHLARHLKADPALVNLDPSIHGALFARGARKPPRRIRVRAMKFEDGVVEAETAEKGLERQRAPETEGEKGD